MRRRERRPNLSNDFLAVACADLFSVFGNTMKSHYPPKHPTEEYRQNIVWLRAFESCGWQGKRAIAAAEKALSDYLKQTKKERVIP
jgi:hypothetical protein